jgi:two-component system phosphate regulon sensor histidine kinase PhoR
MASSETETVGASWLDRVRALTLPVIVAAAAIGVAVVIFNVARPLVALAAFLAIAVVMLSFWWIGSTSAGRIRAREAEQGFGEAALTEAVIGNLSDPAVLLDRDGRVLHLNALAHALAPALRLGEPALFALRSPEIVAALRRAIASGEPQRAEYVEYVPIDRWMELVITPLSVAVSRNASASYILMSFRDQTPLRRVEEMRADFVANASHELRTPLAALSGFIDTLLGPARNDEPARTRFLGIMQAQATRMARLIDDLLSLSRIELSAHVQPQTLVDVGTIVRQVADGLESLAKDRNVAISVEAQASPMMIPGDRDELLRLFENLIENALKYGASGGKVQVSFAPASGNDGQPEVRVAVRDFGPGIAPEHLPRLTERFYRVDVGESRAQGGTGLGLSLVKHTLNRHRGRLLIESVPGQGATFTACLPTSPFSTAPR